MPIWLLQTARIRLFLADRAACGRPHVRLWFRLASSGGDGGAVLVRYGYDEAGRLAEVINSSGQPAGNLVRERDFNGHTVSYGYDPSGLLVERINGAGQVSARPAICSATSWRSGWATRSPRMRTISPDGSCTPQGRTRRSGCRSGIPPRDTDPLGRAHQLSARHPRPGHPPPARHIVRSPHVANVVWHRRDTLWGVSPTSTPGVDCPLRFPASTTTLRRGSATTISATTTPSRPAPRRPTRPRGVRSAEPAGDRDRLTRPPRCQRPVAQRLAGKCGQDSRANCTAARRPVLQIL